MNYRTDLTILCFIMTQNCVPIMTRHFLIFIFSISSILLLLSACQSQKALVRKGHKNLRQQFEQSAIFRNGFTGFALYDIDRKEWLYEQHSDKYFTPASNVKILTLYTALKILGDSIPALRYIELGDSLIFQGTASPALAHPYLPADSTIFHFLSNRKEQLFFSSANFTDQVYGPAWAWDDISYAFQCQRSPLPFHGNTVRVLWYADQNRPSLHPSLFENFLQTSKQKQAAKIKTHPFQNLFTYTLLPPKKDYKRVLPFVVSDSLTIQLLSTYIQRPTQLWQKDLPSFDTAKTIYSFQVDTLYRRMMLPSNNFVAEQLLLSCSQQLFGEINSDSIINYMKNNHFHQLPDPLRWHDGSGLSRYNLMTPRSIVKILELLLQDFGPDRLSSFFPIGGRSGTIQKWYKGQNQPYVYAKTGTMRNRHCLSGYLKTEKGKLLIFSFMHNNYPGVSKPYKEEMEKFLEFIANHY